MSRIESRASDKPVIGGLYQHFKGGVYQVIALAKDEADVNRTLVIYRSIKYGDVWARELSSFLSEVDGEKYPEHAGKQRLEYVGGTNFITGHI